MNLKKKKSKLNKKQIKLSGTITFHKLGFAFVEIRDEDKSLLKEWKDKDVFVKKSNTLDSMEGDIVEIQLIDSILWKNSPEGIVTKILKHNYKEVVGKIEMGKGFAFLLPLDKKIRFDFFVSKKYFNGAKDGDIVRAEIISYAKNGRKPEAKIKELITSRSDNRADIKGLVVASGRELEFADHIRAREKEIKKFNITDELLVDRIDLRDELIFTIDGDYSKDFDDGISLKIDDEENYILGVHIADVAHFVKQGDAIDKEAYKRSNSVYLLDFVLPMLPEGLSNKVCSLMPKEDRLTMTCEMTFNKHGEKIGYRIFESIISSKARLTYKDVSKWLNIGEIAVDDGSNSILPDMEDERDALLESLENMEVLAKIFMRERRLRGSIDFETNEPEIELSKRGKAIGVSLSERTFAHQLIEEFMLKANETVAEHIFWLEVPTVYRNHPRPTTEKIRTIKEFLRGFKINIKGKEDKIKSKQINDVIEEAKDKGINHIVSRALIKAMEKAYYDSLCQGHFGLAMEKYLHFTSPIRRYPDLIVHRTLKYIIHSQFDKLKSQSFEIICQRVGENSSKVEKDTLDLERDVEKMKLVEFMESKIGREFDGVVSGIANSSIFVEVLGCIDGRVSLNSIVTDYFEVDRDNFKIVGVKTGKIYSLGDRVKIKVVRADIESRELDFELSLK